MTPPVAIGIYIVLAAVSVATTILAVVLPRPRRQVKREQSLARIRAFARGGEL